MLMHTRRTLPKASSLHASLLAAISLISVSAVDAYAAVDAAKFRAALEGQLTNFGAQIKLGGVEGRGEDIIVNDIRITTNKGETTTFASIRLENVTTVRGGFNVGRVAFPSTTFPSTDGTFEFGGASFSNITVPEPNAPKDVILYSLGVDVAPMRFVTSAGQDLFRIGRMRVTGTPLSMERESTFVLEPVDMFIDTTVAPKPNADPTAEDALRALGLTKLNVSLASRGSWRMSDGRLISDMTFGLRDAGSMTMAFDITGYTPDVVQALNAAIKATAPPPNATPQQKKDSDAKAGLAFIGIVQQLNLNVLSLRYDDASLTNRALDFAASKNGMQRRDLVNQIKGMVPVLAIQTQDADFATKASNAVSIFLDNPKSLEVRAQPPTPASFMQLFAIGAVTPQALIKQLNLTVTANK